jgi:pimeloyl-ACP methyl ester carboxylesterase
MLRIETLHAEGPRYATSLVLVPGLWAGPPVWRGFASYLAHRGWEAHLLDVRSVSGGMAGRAAAVAEYAASLPSHPVLVGHDAGAVAAWEAARVGAGAAAVVLVAPLLPGSPSTRAFLLETRRLLPLLLGRPVPPPAAAAAALALGELPQAVRAGVAAGLAADAAAVVRDLVRGRPAPAPRTGTPAFVLGGARDPILPPADAERLASAIGAEHQSLSAAGHWPLAGPAWQEAVGRVHRWVVQRLGESLLDRYEEAMADREAEDDDG